MADKEETQTGNASHILMEQVVRAPMGEFVVLMLGIAGILALAIFKMNAWFVLPY